MLECLARIRRGETEKPKCETKMPEIGENHSPERM